MVAADFLRRKLVESPHGAHTLLIDNGVQFGPQVPQLPFGSHSFDRFCREFNLKYRLTKPAPSWTSGQVARPNRTIKEATVQRLHYQTTIALNEHLQTFILTCNHPKHLKSLRRLTPNEFAREQWQKTPAIFGLIPIHHTLGL